MYTVTLDFPAKTEVLHVYVYPLGLYKTDLSTEVFAIIEKDGNLRAGCSKKETEPTRPTEAAKPTEPANLAKPVELAKPAPRYTGNV